MKSGGYDLLAEFQGRSVQDSERVGDVVVANVCAVTVLV